MIIDFHTHAFPDKIAAATVAALAKISNSTPYHNGTREGLLSSLADAGADIGINLPVLTKPGQFESVLRFATELNAAQYRGAKIISFAGAHPDMEDIEGKIKRLKELGFLGIKVHPDYQSTFIDDDRYAEIFSAAKKYGLIVLTHAGLDAAYVGQPIKCTPRRVLKLLDKIGGYDKIVLAHIGGNEMYGEVYSELCGLDIYFDTAYSLNSVGEVTFKKILEKHGDEKILFGSDAPWQNIGVDIDIIKKYNLGEDSERRIFSENARKLLGL